MRAPKHTFKLLSLAAASLILGQNCGPAFSVGSFASSSLGASSSDGSSLGNTPPSANPPSDSMTQVTMRASETIGTKKYSLMSNDALTVSAAYQISLSSTKSYSRIETLLSTIPDGICTLNASTTANPVLSCSSAGHVSLIVNVYDATGYGIGGLDFDADAKSPSDLQPTGASLYATNCASCHGSLASSDKRNKSLASLVGAINDQPTMNSLQSLSALQLHSIVAALDTSVTAATPTPVPSATPTPAATPAVEPVTLSVGNEHVCAIGTTDGLVYCWGANDKGQLGDGTLTNQNTPVAVKGLPSGIAAVGVGESASCAITKDGKAYCWGSNGAGELGRNIANSVLAYSTTPAPIVFDKPIRKIFSHGESFCALTQMDQVYCWGWNSLGERGDGNRDGHDAPTIPVPNLPGPITQMAAGWHTYCALNTLGNEYCWGDRRDGRLGDGTSNVNGASEVSLVAKTLVSGSTGNVKAIADYAYGGCAILKDGTVQCWGVNDHGQLGANGVGLSGSTQPVAIAGVKGAVSLTAQVWSICALLDTGAISCWGYNGYGDLGDGTSGNDKSTPVSIANVPSGIAQWSSGGTHSCLRTTTGAIYCWGRGVEGQMGNGTNTAANSGLVRVKGF